MTGNPIIQAAKLIASADALLITAGAGMGVDSGLPDFRGAEGFWEAYPALATAGVDFQSIANLAAFRKNPKLAWGFYGHRLALYRNTIPHDGFRILKQIASRMSRGDFVITSNVDGQFQKAGFEDISVLEVHGSIHHMQCCQPCCSTIWSAEFTEPNIDNGRCEWFGKPLPTCDKCQDIARPNILMFDDWTWINTRTKRQRTALDMWSGKQSGRRIVIEVGAGIDIPTIRHSTLAQRCPVIRINTRHAELPEGMGVSLPMGAKIALAEIEAELVRNGWLASDAD